MHFFLKLRLEVHSFEAVGANKAFPEQFLERKAAFLCLVQVPLGVAIFFSCFSTFLPCDYALQCWCAWAVAEFDCINCCIFVLRGDLFVWLFHRASVWRSCSWHLCLPLHNVPCFSQGKINSLWQPCQEQHMQTPCPGTPSFPAATRGVREHTGFPCVTPQPLCLKETSLGLQLFLSSCTWVQPVTAHCFRSQSVPRSAARDELENVSLLQCYCCYRTR